MKTRQKENALNEFLDMIKHSWTYDRMTYDERRCCLDTLLSNVTEDSLKGTWDSRWRILQAVYSAFLAGLGFDGGNWREPDPENVPF